MRAMAVNVLAAALVVSMTPAPHVASPVAAATITAVAAPGTAAAVVASKAKKKAKKKRKRVVLRVVARGYPGAARPRIVVATKGLRKNVPRSGKLRGLPRGKYRVWATPVVIDGGTSAVPDLPRKVKVRPKKKRAVLRMQYVWSPRNDTYPPSPARSVEVVRSTPTSVNLRWINGNAPDLQVVAVRRKLGDAAPTRLDDGRPVGTDRLTTELTDTGLRPHTTYSYSVFMLDAAGNPSTPASVTVRTPGEAASITAGRAHTCALLATESSLSNAGIAAIGPRDLVECWGANDSGQLGVGDGVVDTDAPLPVDLADVEKVVAGADHTCALRTGGDVLCWGRNDDGQTDPEQGDEPISVPHEVDLPAAVDVAAGGGHSCAVLEEGSVRCWGANESGQLGADEPGAFQDVPGVDTAVSVTAGHAHSCALLEDRSLLCWGANESGQLGDGSRRDLAEPVTAKVSDVRAVSAGVLHTCAVRQDDALFCWGDDEYGQLGFGTPAGSPTPGPVSLPPVAEVSAGAYHTCAVLGDDAMRCWGRNSAGRLGDGTTVDRRTPVPVDVPAVSALAAGGYHSCVATSAGSFCWGANGRGQLGVGGFRDAYLPEEVRGL